MLWKGTEFLLCSLAYDNKGMESPVTPPTWENALIESGGGYIATDQRTFQYVLLGFRQFPLTLFPITSSEMSLPTHWGGFKYLLSVLNNMKYSLMLSFCG